MHQTLEDTAEKYHHRLPGIVRASLVDEGISSDVIDRREIGWDGHYVTVPVRDERSLVVFIERLDPNSMEPISAPGEHVELFPWSMLDCPGSHVFLVEGIRESLILESQGLRTITATGTGRIFKERDWGEAFRSIPELVVAYRRGNHHDRRRFLPTRRELIRKINRAVPHARLLEWPREVGQNGGAYDFFVRLGRSRNDFETLLSQSP